MCSRSRCTTLFEAISDEITLWWDEFQFPIQGRYPIPIQGRFQIYHPGRKVTCDEDGETVYDYYARLVNAIILELTRRLSEVRLLSVRSLSDRQINLSEDKELLHINLQAIGRCIATEPYNKLLQDTRQAGGGLHEMGKGSVRAAIASEGYLLDVGVTLHNVHVHDQVFITKNDEHVEELSMKQ